MRPNIIKFMCIILLSILLVGCSSELKDYDNSSVAPTEGGAKGDLTSMNFKFLQESEYDDKTLKSQLGIDENIILTFFDSTHSQENFENLAKGYSFDYTKDFDFDNYCIFISYGRKISELECKNDEYYGESWFYFIVTFEEGQPENKVFFYQIDKKNYVPSTHGMECYIMDGDERVYLGSDVFAINTSK